MNTTSLTEQQISELTGFDCGDQFESEQQVRDYFTINNMKAMFYDPNPALDLTERELDRMADAVIEHRWHCRFEKQLHIRNLHDDGWDLATGRDIASGRVIGSLFWDSTVGDTAGWVLRFGEEGFNAEDHLPDTTSEITALLAEHGYELDASSLSEIERFEGER